MTNEPSGCIATDDSSLPPTSIVPSDAAALTRPPSMSQTVESL
jgi:hypothetical protein